MLQIDGLLNAIRESDEIKIVDKNSSLEMMIAHKVSIAFRHQSSSRQAQAEAKAQAEAEGLHCLSASVVFTTRSVSQGPTLSR